MKRLKRLGENGKKDCDNKTSSFFIQISCDGKTPKALKNAIIILMHKKGNAKENYRPNRLSNCSKKSSHTAPLIH